MFGYKYQRKRGIRRKMKLVLMMGGKCSMCGYSKNFSALALHHTNPPLKKFEINLKSLSKHSWQTILDEAQKCILVCLNCHSELHYPDNLMAAVLSDADKVTSETARKPENFCCDCGTLLAVKTSVRCPTCQCRHREKVDWPDSAILLGMIRNSSFSAVAREFGVSDNALRHRLKHHPVISHGGETRTPMDPLTVSRLGGETGTP
jgi:hypothetical protein